MRNVFTITLLLVHLFNVVGYNLLFGFFIRQSETSLVHQLNHTQYNDSELLLLKTPLHLPYYTSSGDVERVDGEITIDGTHYNYVKRKISNDTLYLYCIPNTEKTKWSKAKSDFANESNDAAPESRKGNTPLLKKMIWGAEYSDAILQYSFTALQAVPLRQRPFLLHVKAAPFTPSPAKPPEPA